MYPKIFLEYFRDFERTNRVFVAMPFSPDFKPRWDDVFRPAIEAVGLEAFRVDMRKTGDSIQTEILQQISQAQLILVDVSTDETGHRNANVMYELGVAHASRLPDEVIIVRSDRSDEGNCLLISARFGLRGLIRMIKRKLKTQWWDYWIRH
jgi:hypothetical protein